MDNPSSAPPHPDPPVIDLKSIIHPTESLSPALRTLRRSFELLSVSYFVTMFGPAIGFSEFSVRNLEADLDGTSSDCYIPTLAIRLLVLLSGDRCINLNNWESRLRREFLKRDPVGNPLGSEPLKSKPRLPKRAVGYVYISEYVVGVPGVVKAQPMPPTVKEIIPPPSISNLLPTSLVCLGDLDDQNTFKKSDNIPPSTKPEEATLMEGQASDTPTIEPKVVSISPPQDQKKSDSVPVATNVVPVSNPEENSADVSLVDKSFKIPSLEPAHAPVDQTHLEDSSAEDASPTITWSELSPLTKLRALFKLCEWNFETAHDLDRFRRMIEGKAIGFAGMNLLTGGSADGAFEPGDWRLEPCGKDSNGHLYWFTGHGIESTLWIQRKEPQPPRKTIITLRLPPPSTSKRRGKQAKGRLSEPRANIRKRPPDHPSDRTGAAPQSPQVCARTTAAQSKRGSTVSNYTPKAKRPRLSGTRTSSRLRNSTKAEDWQTSPAAWQDEEDHKLESPSVATKTDRAPTVIVIKKSAVMSSKSKRLERVVSGTRASPRHRAGGGEEWQDVPEGWFEDVSIDRSAQVRTSQAHDPSRTPIPEPSKACSNSHPPSSSALSSELSDDLSSVDEDVRPDEVDEEPTELKQQVQDDTKPALEPAEAEADVNMRNRAPEPVEAVPEVQMTDATTECADVDTALRIANGITETETDSGLQAFVVSVEPISDQQTAEDGNMQIDNETFEPLECVPEVKMVEQPLPDIPTESQIGLELDQADIPVSLPSVQTSEITSVPPPETTTPKEEPGAPDESRAELQSTELKIGMELTTSTNALEAHKTEEVRVDNDSIHHPQMKGHPLDPDWIGWEVVCSNLAEWQQFSRQFEGTTNSDELALLGFVSEVILPMLVEAHEENQKRLKLEESMALRKRSNRIATREVVQASVADAAAAAQERETRLHSERLEARRLKESETEEEKKIKEEDQRLVRLREREERIALREAQMIMEREEEKKRVERARLRAEAKVLGQAVKVARSGAENAVTSLDSGESWELDCEICGVMGKNMDDGSEVICCDKCEKWQHLSCHNKADEIRRQPKRDWTTIDFICSMCSGIPVPKSVKQLRTHVNGKLKPKPRPRAKKAKPEVDGVLDAGGLEENVTPTRRLKSRITLLVSHPSKPGEASVRQIPPVQPLGAAGIPPAQPLGAAGIPPPTSFTGFPQQTMSQARSRGSMSAHIAPALSGNGFHPSPIFSQQALSPSISPHISPALASAQASLPSIPAVLPVTGLEPYYDDLEKLIPILKADIQLHRVLPVAVMHRVRRYLIEQQQRRQSLSDNNTATSSAALSAPPAATQITPGLACHPAAVPPQASIPMIAQLNSLNQPCEPGPPLPPITNALATAACWYDEVNPKDPNLIESFVDPSFTLEKNKVTSSVRMDKQEEVKIQSEVSNVQVVSSTPLKNGTIQATGEE